MWYPASAAFPPSSGPQLGAAPHAAPPLFINIIRCTHTVLPAHTPYCLHIPHTACIRTPHSLHTYPIRPALSLTSALCFFCAVLFNIHLVHQLPAHRPHTACAHTHATRTTCTRTPHYLHAHTVPPALSLTSACTHTLTPPAHTPYCLHTHAHAPPARTPQAASTQTPRTA